MNFLSKFFLVINTTFLSSFTWGQPQIKGPQCVVPGVQYEYTFVTADSMKSGISLCVVNGSVAGMQSTCINDSLLSFVLVTWNPNDSVCSLNYTDNTGSLNFAVHITTNLTAGTIDNNDLFRTVSYDSIVSRIGCGAASGGNCEPGYIYQWQISTDNLTWTDINGGTKEDMDQEIHLQITSYFRRKVTETKSGSMAYSNIATVFVNPQQPGN